MYRVENHCWRSRGCGYSQAQTSCQPRALACLLLHSVLANSCTLCPMVESRLSTLASPIPVDPFQWIFAWIDLHQGHNPSMEGWPLWVLCLFSFALSPPPFACDHGSQQWEGCSLTWFIIPRVKCYHSLTQWRVLCLTGISGLFYTLAALDMERTAGFPSMVFLIWLHSVSLMSLWCVEYFIFEVPWNAFPTGALAAGKEWAEYQVSTPGIRLLQILLPSRPAHGLGHDLGIRKW